MMFALKKEVLRNQCKYKRYVFGLLLVCFSCLVLAQHQPIIPQPQQVKNGKGHFELKERGIIYYNDPALRSMANYVSGAIESKAGFNFSTSSKSAKKNRSGNIRLFIDTTVQTGTEGYSLEVLPNRIDLKAKTPQGLFYAVQSLLQLLENRQGKLIQCLKIEDEPRFSWRGLMLDVSRHFFTVEEVKRLIDEMVVYKFNLLHLHLTDDQGWRVEIKALPELTRVGAWRVPRTGLWWEREPPHEDEAATYGGFYTQKEIKELVAYAAANFVQVLPEIDVPGHSLAAIAAYPYLSTTKLPYKVNPGSLFYGIDDNALSPIQETTYEFLDKVFTEVAELFPFEYIHIGGDECFKGFWEKDEATVQFMKENGLKDVNELQSYFIKRIEQMLKAKGKKLLGWDEILEGGLAPEATVMSWRGMAGGIAAAKEQHHVVMSPTNHAYLDLYQGDPAIEPPTYSMLRFKDVYAFDPVPEGVDPTYILGGQGNLWTESVPTFRHAEYMLWPRSLALSEVLWTEPANKNWSNFIHRTERHLKWFEQQDINYAHSFYDAIISPIKDGQGKLTIKLSTEIEELEMYFTFDNTYPDHHSALYKAGEVLSIPTDADTFRVITYRNGKPIGRMIEVSLSDLLKRAE